jgi:hypothetical protein
LDAKCRLIVFILGLSRQIYRSGFGDRFTFQDLRLRGKNSILGT